MSSQPAGAQGVPLVSIVGGAIYYSLDGGVTWTEAAAAPSAISTSAPLSGNGTVGTPATIAAGAVPLTALATEADQTIVGNVSGGAASPVALTVTQVRTMIGAMSSLTGDVTGTGPGATAATIATAAVTNAKLANMGANTVKGSVAGGVPADLTAAQVAAIVNSSNLVPAAWYNARAQEMLAVVPQLTEFSTVKVGQFPGGTSAGTAGTQDSLSEGGGRAGATASAILVFASSVFQTMNTGKWAICFRAKMAVTSTGHINQFGLINAASTHLVSLESAFDVDATHWVMKFVGAGTTTTIGTIASDASFHNFMLTGNGTNISIYVDNALAATSSTLTNVVDEAVFPFLSDTVAGESVCTKLLYGYIAP